MKNKTLWDMDNEDYQNFLKNRDLFENFLRNNVETVSTTGWQCIEGMEWQGVYINLDAPEESHIHMTKHCFGSVTDHHFDLNTLVVTDIETLKQVRRDKILSDIQSTRAKKDLEEQIKSTKAAKALLELDLIALKTEITATARSSVEKVSRKDNAQSVVREYDRLVQGLKKLSHMVPPTVVNNRDIAIAEMRELEKCYNNIYKPMINKLIDQRDIKTQEVLELKIRYKSQRAIKGD